MQQLALGTAQFGLDYGITNQRGALGPEDARRVLAVAWEGGMRMLDTALTARTSMLEARFLAGSPDVFAMRHACLRRHDDRRVFAFFGQLFRERQDRRCFADLSRRMDDEVELLIDQVADVSKPPQSGKRVTVTRIVRACGVESTSTTLRHGRDCST